MTSIHRIRSSIAAWSPLLVGLCAAVPASAGEKVLRKDVTISASITAVWDAWTSEAGIASFFSPESKIEMTPGGAYEIYMIEKSKMPTGKRGSEGCRLLSFIPHEMLAFEWSFPPAVPTLREADARTQVVLRFRALEDGRVRLDFAQLGWKNGEDWDKGYDYFDKAWTHVLRQLKTSLEKSPAPTASAPKSGERHETNGRVEVFWGDKPIRYQRFEMSAPAGVKKVWNLLATTNGLKKLGGKEPRVELKPGGKYAFWPDANNRVLAYVPREMLSTSGSAPPRFPNVRKGGTWSAYFFEPIDEKSTKLRLVCVGWRPGEKEWDEAFDYFLKANAEFLNGVYDKLTGERSSDAGDLLRHEVIVEAPVADVWEALTTDRGAESWMVAQAKIDLRVGGKMLTHYNPNGTLGDSNTIENTILSYEPERMLSIKVTKPPENFPYKEAIESMWSVIRLEPISDKQTRVTCTGMGYGDDEASRKLRAHFEKGNDWTLKKLKERFARRTQESAATSDSSHEHSEGNDS